jgi:hypothetical protein
LAKILIFIAKEESMSCVSILSLRQTPRRNRMHHPWNIVTSAVAAILLYDAPRTVFAQAEADFEKPPVLEAKDLVPEKLLVGKGVRIEDKVPEESSRAFTHNPAIPLSLQVALVENLARLADASGRAGVITLASDLLTESQARFIASSVRMLADSHEKTKPITALAALGPVIGRNRDGAIILPAPVDYVSWTERIASFATNPDLKAEQRTVLLSGKMSPRAKKEFAALGWTVQEGTAS